MRTILFDGDRVEHLDSLEDRPGRLQGSMLLWVDLAHSSPEDVRQVAVEFSLDDESVERLLDPSGGVGFRDRGAYIHLTASTPDDGADGQPNEVDTGIRDLPTRRTTRWDHGHELQARPVHAPLPLLGDDRLHHLDSGHHDRRRQGSAVDLVIPIRSRPNLAVGRIVAR